MRVAIGGSSGLLGTALSRRLVAGGHEVVRLVRGDVTGSGQRRWDPDAGRIDGPGLDDVDAVVNLSGAPIAGARWTKDRKVEIRRSRITSTLTIVTSLAPGGRCQRLLNASAIGYYGNTGTEIVDESMPVGRGFLAEVVADWEAAAAHSPVPTAVLRTGHVLAREGGYLALQWPIFALGLGGRVGNGRQFLSWISLADHVRAMEFLLASDLTGPVNLVGPNPVSNAEFTRAFGRHLHRPTPMPLPLTAVGAIFGREFVTDALLASQRIRPARLLDAGFEFEHPRVTKALAALG
ncbi:MAG: TIGR01777 family oxidoreductase [Propionicimonas sp.]|uniref:TIGR01777 family oxidoreductase n=1 Tax=Propionicimonas sp. TaxID=1955623 RepID=UPI003D1386D8